MHSSWPRKSNGCSTSSRRRTSDDRLWQRVLLLALAVLLPGTSSLAAEPSDLVEQGEAIYRQGLLPSGERLQGRTVGDVEISGITAACAGCHRPSGFGSSEGGAYVPPITGPALFNRRQLDRADRFRDLYQASNSSVLHAQMRDPRLRPAYEGEALGKVLRSGVDPTGRLLDAVMPRYQLEDSELAALEAYLRALGSRSDPGVEAQRLHFATVMTPGVDSDQAEAMLDVLRAYVRRQNTAVSGFLARPGHSPSYRDDFRDSYRLWVLHTWQLEGPPATWQQQLEEHYRRHPVFAMVSGLGASVWQPVHDFCDAAKIPCLFPNTDHPPVDPGNYSLYLSPGLEAEGRALGHFLKSLGSGPNETSTLQIWRRGELEHAAVSGLRTAFPETLKAVMIEPEKPLTSAHWQRVLDQHRPKQLVLWLSENDLSGLAALPQEMDRIEAIYLSTSLIPELPNALAPWRSKIWAMHRFAVEGDEVPRIHRVRGWLRSRGIERRHERLQLNTYFALTLADHALMHLVGNFSRDYFLESIEHEVENGLNPGTFPHMSLGPGQRFASRGCTVVRWNEHGAMEAVSDWIVPSLD